MIGIKQQKPIITIAQQEGCEPSYCVLRGSVGMKPLSLISTHTLFGMSIALSVSIEFSLRKILTYYSVVLISLKVSYAFSRTRNNS